VLIKYKSKSPEIHKSVYLAEGTYIIGDVKIDEDSSVWFASVIRGDVAPVSIGKGTNIQDGAVIHTSRYNGPTHIGDYVTIGHSAVVHACTLHNYAFVGMKALVMDKAIIEEFGFVAAGAVISPGKIVKSRELWAGVPAKYIRDLTAEEVEKIKESATNYIVLAKDYTNSSN
jgi:carbonic anhydrase/acetyltransferase-like protein (isoleucine patch superfamily)